MDNNIDNQIKDKLLRMQLTNIRKSRNISQEEVSKKSGLSRSCISNIESGDLSSPTLRSLIRYANAIDVEIYVNIQDNQQSSES